MIIDSSKDMDVDSLEGDILFVGDESSDLFKKLKAAGKVKEALSIEQVQGKECDYLVVDIGWKRDFTSPF